MRHHAFGIEAEAEEGIAIAHAWIKKELGMRIENNPDVIVLRHGLFSVEDARQVSELAAGAPFIGEHKVIIIAAARAYHEAQNALLKIFEEPPRGTYLFLVLPSLGGLLSTLRSRMHMLEPHDGHRKLVIPEIAEEFIKATREKRSALAKKLATGRDEDERREHRETAIALVNGIEAAAYHCEGLTLTKHTALLSEIAILRGYLYDRGAPVKMILEHLAIVTPKNLA